jgi:hypothetical protein
MARTSLADIVAPVKFDGRSISHSPSATLAWLAMARGLLEWAARSWSDAELAAAAGDWIAVQDLLRCAITAAQLLLDHLGRLQPKSSGASEPLGLRRDQANEAVDA